MSYLAPPKFKVPPNATPTRKFRDRVTTRGHVIAALANGQGWTRGVELGTGDGKTAATVLHYAKRLHLTTVDLWEPQPDNTGPENWVDWPHEIHEQAARNKLAAYARRQRILKMTTKAAADLIEDGSLDFVFIDADHSEYAVRADITAWTPKIRTHGMLLGHDINWPTVKAAVEDLCPGYWIGPDNTWGITL